MSSRRLVQTEEKESGIISFSRETAPGGGPEQGETDMSDKKRILVTDDEPNLLDMMVDFCDAIDLEPIPAENGTQCLEKALSEKPDAITVDNRMPDISGLDVIAKLKADPATKGIPIILCTADGKLHEAEALKRGAFSVLSKPVSRADLKKVLEACLGPW